MIGRRTIRRSWAVVAIGLLAALPGVAQREATAPDERARETLGRFVERVEAPELSSLRARRELAQTFPLHAVSRLGARDERTSILVNGAVRWISREPDTWAIHLLARRLCEEAHGGAPLEPIADALLAHPAPSVRRSATCYFAERGEAGAAPLLARLPTEGDVAVRIAMIDSLARVDAYDFMSEFASVMREGEEELAGWLLLAASAELDDEQLRATAWRARHGSLGVRRQAVSLLVRAVADEELKRGLAAEIWNARQDRPLEDAMLLDALVPDLVSAERARDVVVERLTHADRDVRRAALAVVVASDEERLVDDVIAMAEAGPRAAIDAAHALGGTVLREVDERRVLRFLERAVRQGEDELRAAALGAMVRQGLQDAVPTLRRVVRDPQADFESRRLAAAGLQRTAADELSTLVAELSGRGEESEFSEWLDAVGLVLAEGFPIELPGIPDWSLPAWEPRWVLQGERASTRTVRCEATVPGTTESRATRRIAVLVPAEPIDFYDDGVLEVVRVRGDDFPTCWIETAALRALDADEPWPAARTGDAVTELDVAVDSLRETSLARLEAAGVIERFDEDGDVVGVRIDWGTLNGERLEWLRIATDLIDSGFLRVVRENRDRIRDLYGTLDGWEAWLGPPRADGPTREIERR